MTTISEETFRNAANGFKQDDSSKDSGQRLNVPGYLNHYDKSFQIKSNGVDTIYALEFCPFDSSHVWESSIIQKQTGQLLFQCFHNSCKGHTWKEARQIISGDDSLAQFMEGGETGGKQETVDWPEPLPLEESLPPVQKLDPEMIPEPIRPWLTDIAERMQIPLDFPTVAALVALCAVVGRKCAIFPKSRDDWKVIPNIWGVIIGRSAMMKSPAVTEAQKPLTRLEIEARKKYNAAMEAYALEKEIADMGIKALKQKLNEAIKQSDTSEIELIKQELAATRPVEPIRTRYQTQDGTVEKIGEILIENPKGLLINRDELTGCLRGLDKPGHDGDRSFFLESWNGDKGFTYDRIGRGTLDVEALCLSIFGCCTPGGIIDYIRSAAEGGRGDDGLIQRFQMMVWPDGQSDWVNVDRWPDTAAKDRAWEIFQKLSKLEIGHE